MVGVVPAVFMVHRTLLGDRPVPKTWAEVLTAEFENSLALPVGDFDLFDALLLGVHRSFRVAGVEQPARNMFQQMHPAQMVAGAPTAGATTGAASGQPLIDTIAGESMSRVLSTLGLFPSTHPKNGDFSPEAHPLQWPGWDQLLSPDLPDTLQRTTDTFERIIAQRNQVVPV